MQIDSRNFEEEVNFILEKIQSAHFIAFDCQFTGLVTQTQHIEGLFPDYREFYERIKETALNFDLLQLGITLFHFQHGKYCPQSFNFLVSARSKKGFNKILVSEWESAAFLAKNNLNFSQVFQHGLKFKRIDGEEEPEPNFNPLADKLHSAKIYFSQQDQALIKQIDEKFKDEKPVQVDFRTKRIFDHFRCKYQLLLDKGKKQMEKYEYHCRFAPTEKDFFEEESSKNVEQYMKSFENDQKNKMEGKSKTLEVILEKIIKCAKPIVGHFPNLDIGLIYQTFIDDLPDTFEEFSYKINKLFPLLFDTKVISRKLQTKLKSIKVDLKSLYKAIYNPKLLEPHSNFNFQHVQKYTKIDSSHDAGFDSFMTGCAFIAMLNCLYDQKKSAFDFGRAEEFNSILYSRFTGEISLIGPHYTPKTKEFQRKVVISEVVNDEEVQKEVGELLSEFGTLSVVEDHGETYYVFDEEQDMEMVLERVKGVKSYDKRAIVRARQIYK